MSQLDLYVYECVECGEREVLASDSVAPPEVHLHGKELVYCAECETDRKMEFLGLEGFEEDTFVLDGETRDRYCPLCDGACDKQS